MVLFFVVYKTKVIKMRNAMWVGGGITGMGEIPMLGVKEKGIAKVIRDIFRNGEQGFFYDPNDLSTMYQDVAGTVPVTSVGQPVGLMLDKSKGMVLGGERVVNYDFSNGNTNWTVRNADATHAVTFVDGKVRYQSATTTPVLALEQSGVMVGGKWYEVTVVCSDYVSGSLKIDAANGGVVVASGLGTFKTKILALNGVLVLVRNALNVDLTIDSISVKELAGNHAYQTTSAARPILRRTPILGDELAVNAVSSNGATGWVAALQSTLTKTGNNLRVTATGSTPYAQQIITNLTIGKTYSVTIPAALKGASGTWYVYLGNTTGLFKTEYFSRSALIDNTFVFTATSTLLNIQVAGANITIGDYGDVQPITVKEVTGYRTDQNYLAFDGSDDFLVTNNIDFTATDKVSLFAGVRKLSDSSQGLLTELGNAVSNSFLAHVGGGSGIESYTFGSRGNGLYSYAILTKSANPTLTAPHSSVVSAKSDISSNISYIKANGRAVTNSIDQGGGTYGNLPLFIGRRGGTSLPFNGHLYSLIGIGKLTSDKETVAIEKELAKRVGVTLNV